MRPRLPGGAGGALGATRALVEAVRVISAGGHDLDATLDALVEQARRLFDVPDVAINLRDPDTGQYLRRRTSALVDPTSTYAVPGTPIMLSAAAQEALATGRAVLVEDFRRDGRVNPRSRAALPTVTGMLAVPLVDEGAAVGLMLVRWTDRRRIEPPDVELAEALGQHAAVAIRGARLVAEVRREAQYRERADALTAALAVASTREEVAEALVGRAPLAVGASAGAVLLPSGRGDEPALLRTEGYPADRVASASGGQPADVQPAAAAAREGAPLFLESPEAIDARFPGSSGPAGGDAAVAAFPLRVGERVIGALQLGFARPRRFSAADRSWIASLARRGAQAVERAGLHDALRRSDERYRLVTGAARATVWEWDPESEALAWEGAGPAAYGYTGAIADSGEWWNALVHPADREKLRRTVRDALAHGAQGYEVDYRFRQADGSYAWCRSVGWIVCTDPPRVLGITMDVTALRTAEEERDRLADALARAAERERVAMDLHDGATQQLFVARLALSRAVRSADADPAGAIGQAQAIVGQVQTSLRRYMESLLAPTDEATLEETITAAVEGLTEAAGAAITTNVDPAAAARFPATAAEHLGYVVREAVGNALRHGRARRVAVDVRRSRGQAVLTVRDDGVGFDRPRARPGKGLSNMRRRATLVGGRLTIRSRSGEGTTVRLAVREAVSPRPEPGRARG